jgi:Outer membrane protein beta-barrel domain
MKKNLSSAIKKTTYAPVKQRFFLAAIACSILYFGYLQPVQAQQISAAKPLMGYGLSVIDYQKSPSAWNNVFLNIEAQPATFTNYRAPKIQLSTAKTSLGLRLGYRLTPILSLSSYYSKALNGDQTDALSLLPTKNAFTPKFGLNRFGSTNTGLDLAAHISMLNRLTLFGHVGIANYSYGNNSTTKFARFGLGLHYDINTRLGLRLEIERLRPLSPVNSAFGVENGLDNYSLGAAFKF